jgi:hypothetical protein
MSVRVKLTFSEKTCPSTILSTTNPIWYDPGSIPAHRGLKPYTNRMSTHQSVSSSALQLYVTEYAV